MNPIKRVTNLYHRHLKQEKRWPAACCRMVQFGLAFRQILPTTSRIPIPISVEVAEKNFKLRLKDPGGVYKGPSPLISYIEAIDNAERNDVTVMLCLGQDSSAIMSASVSSVPR
jgi:hypothetical protein